MTEEARTTSGGPPPQLLPITETGVLQASGNSAMQGSGRVQTQAHGDRTQGTTGGQGRRALGMLIAGQSRGHSRLSLS